MALLRSLLAESQNARPGNPHPFILVQSSAAQSALPVLRGLVERAAAAAAAPHDGPAAVVLLATLYAPADVLGRAAREPGAPAVRVRVLDWTGLVPGYAGDARGCDEKLKAVADAVKDCTGALSVVVDSVDTIDDDFGSASKTYRFLSSILASLSARKDPSRLICHLTSTSRLRPLLLDTSFSPALVHLSAHPPALLTHIASAYLAPPPPASAPGDGSPDDVKFWRVFLPLSERTHEVEALVFGAEGEGGGGGSADDELVVETLVRSRNTDRQVAVAAGSRRRGVQRSLEGWSAAKAGPVPLESLDSLKSAFKRTTIIEKNAPDPTKNLTFNLNLTETQQASRSQVPLPYEHEGQPQNAEQKGPGQIFYDPDSADDLDDEDPDEDLDI